MLNLLVHSRGFNRNCLVILALGAGGFGLTLGGVRCSADLTVGAVPEAAPCVYMAPEVPNPEAEPRPDCARRPPAGRPPLRTPQRASPQSPARVPCSPAAR